MLDVPGFGAPLSLHARTWERYGTPAGKTMAPPVDSRFGRHQLMTGLSSGEIAYPSVNLAV